MEMTVVEDVMEVSLHSQTGLRFMHLKFSLDNIEESYSKENLDDSNMHLKNYPSFTFMTEKSYLRQHLNYWLYEIIMVNGGTSIQYCKTGLCHIPNNLRHKEDGRRELPTSIYQALLNTDQLWKSRKVSLTWIVCYLKGLLPDMDKPDWDSFQCSHLCLGAGQNLPCLNSNHLCWESASKNQARGTRDCLKLCHCGCKKSICEANSIHVPSCLSPFKI
jgi:hypothetical protein